MTELYLISPDNLSENSYDGFFAELEQIFSESKPAIFQLRLKNVSADYILKAAIKSANLCNKYDVVFIVNDNAEIARDSGAAGVHLGEDDISYSSARKILGDSAIIGISSYNSTDRAMTYAEEGADYVAFGAVFNTTTKIAKTSASLEMIEDWCNNTIIPAVAIGGINYTNIIDVAKTKVDFAAISSGIWKHDKGAVYAAKEINKLLATSLKA